MLDFIRKDLLWELFDSGIPSKIAPSRAGFHLKTIQDMAVFNEIGLLEGQTIGEIGGGESRILPALSRSNTRHNIEKFLGNDGGPAMEKHIEGVRNIKVNLGEYSSELAAGSYDCLFSVSVVEHVPNDRLDDFFRDGMRVLRSGGLWIHAIDMYLSDEPLPAAVHRFGRYASWFSGGDLVPRGAIYDGPVQFFCNMASNPDNTMYSWAKVSPKLDPLRRSAQSVSIIMAGYRR